MKSKGITEEEILDLIGQDYNKKQIAEKKGVYPSTINNYIKKIDPDKLRTAEEKAEIIRHNKQEELLNLISAGKKIHQIADIKGEKVAHINYEIGKIDPKRVKNAREKAAKLKQENKKEEVHSNSKRVDRPTMRKRTIREMVKAKSEKRSITVNDTKAYRSYIDEKYDQIEYEDIVLLITAYTKTKQIWEAIRFLNMIINNRDFEYLGIDRIKKLKMQIEQVQKEQKIRDLIRLGKNDREIITQTGYKEIEVLIVRRKMREMEIANGGNSR